MISSGASCEKSIIWSTSRSYSCAEYLVSPLTPGGRSNQGLHLQPGQKISNHNSEAKKGVLIVVEGVE